MCKFQFEHRLSERFKHQVLTYVCSQSHMNFRITSMTFYTEEVQSDSKAFDLYKGGAWFKPQLGHRLSSLQYFLVHPDKYGTWKVGP